MKPYFQEDGVTLYCGDNRDVLPSLEPGCVAITDQPYGTGWTRGGGRQGEFKSAVTKADWDVFSTEWVKLLNSPKRVAAFTPAVRLEEMCNVLPRRVVGYYRKTNVRPKSLDRDPVVISPPPTRTGTWDFTTYNGDAPFHPCQKPDDLMRWLVALTSDEGDTILDPFMGSGTTLRAAKDLGRKAIGIEISREYCDIAIERLRQSVLPLTA